MRVETGSLPSSELVVASSRTVNCSAGEVRVRFQPERLGFICLLRGQGAWRNSSSRDRLLGPGSVIAWSGEGAAAVLLITAAEVAVVSVERAATAGSLFQELYPHATLAHFGPAEGLERLRGLLALLPQAPQGAVPNTPTGECLLLALIWSVHEQREPSSTQAFSDPAVSSALRILERDPAVSSALRILERDPAVSSALRILERDPAVSSALRILERDPAVSSALRILERDPAVSSALRILERDPAVSSALRILERELARRLSVPLLAKRVGLSRSAFVRRFSAALGLPPEKYLTWLRLRRAAELLVTTDAGLAAIASEVGYASEFSLSRAFRRWYGVPPGTYRQQPTAGVPRTFARAA